MQTIIAGRNPVIEALKAGTPIEKILMLKGIHGEGIEMVLAMAEKKGIKIETLDKNEFRQIAPDVTAQGIVAVVPPKKLVGLEEIMATAAGRNEKGFILILDEIEDPQNLGALVRTAECAGVHGVVLPKHHAAPVTGAAVKASAGATAHMAMAEVTNIVNALETLKSAGYWIVGLDTAGEKTYTEADYTSPVGIVVGNEGKGIRRLVKEHCDHLVKIPLYGKIASLNASVAGALVLYEVVKQRYRSGPRSA